MSRNQNQARALLDAWTVVVRFRWQLIIPTFLVITGVLAMSLLLPRKYSATAIFERRMDPVLQEITDRGGTRIYTRQPTSMAYEIAGELAVDAMLKDIEGQLQAISERRGKRIDLPSLRAEMLARLIVRRDVATKSLDRVRVQYTGNDAEIARLAVNTLVRNYIDRTRKELDQRLAHGKDFFDAEVSSSRAKIERLENQRLTFEIEHADLLPDNPNNVQMTLSQSKLRSVELNEMREAAQIKVQKLAEALQRTPETIPTFVRKPNPDRALMQRSLMKLRQKLNTYVAVRKMRDEHPDVIDLRYQIAAAQLKVIKMPPEVISEEHISKNPKRAGLDLLLTEAEAEAEALERQWRASIGKINELSVRAGQLFPVRAEYSKIERNVERALRHLAFWESNLNRVNMSLTAASGDRGIQMAFVKPCGRIGRPVSPDLLHVLMAALGLGVVSGAVSVIFAHRTSESFLTGEQLSKAVGLPLTGTVSEIISKQQRRLKRLRRWVLSPLSLAGMSAVVLMMVGLLYSSVQRPVMPDSIQADLTGMVEAAPAAGSSSKAVEAQD